MAGSFTLPTVLANLTAGNQPLSLIDGDLNALANPLLALGTFSNYYVDAGSANAYAITVSSPQTVALAAGLPIQFIAANANTGASTLQINALAAKNILTPSGSALAGGQIAAGAVISVIYTGTSFLLVGGAAISTSMMSFCNGSLSAGLTLYYNYQRATTTEAEVKMPMPFAGTFSRLYVAASTAPTGAETFIATMRKNGADTTITCTITGAAVSANDTTHSATFAAGDLIDLKIVSSGGAATAYLNSQVQISA